MARMFNPPHPGELLREFLPEGMTIEEVAGRLGVSRAQLSRVLNGRSAVSADMAIHVGLLTNTTPESWLGGQTNGICGKRRKDHFRRLRRSVAQRSRFK